MCPQNTDAYKYEGRSRVFDLIKKTNTQNADVLSFRQIMGNGQEEKLVSTPSYLFSIRLLAEIIIIINYCLLFISARVLQFKAS